MIEKNRSILSKIQKKSDLNSQDFLHCTNNRIQKVAYCDVSHSKLVKPMR